MKKSEEIKEKAKQVKQPLDRRKKLLIYGLLSLLIVSPIIIIFLFIYLGILSYIRDPYPQKTEEIINTNEKTQNDDLIYNDTNERMTFTLEGTNWKEGEYIFPKDIVTSNIISFDSRDSSCSIVYGQFNKEMLLKIQNAQERIYTENNISLPLITAEHDTSTEEISKLKFAAFPNFPYKTSTKGIMVYATSENPISDECERDFEQVTREREIDYISSVITIKSTGIIYFLTTDTTHRVIFQDKENGREYTISENLYSKEYEYLIDALSPQQVDYNIYYLLGSTTNPTLEKANLATGESTQILLEYDKSKPIHDFFVHNNLIYYLSGEFCNQYIAPCNLDLKVFNQSTSKTEILASGLKSREILGFEKTGKKLLLQYADGDAGCSFVTHEEYNMDTKKVSKIFDLSFCINLDSEPVGNWATPEDEAAYKQYKEFENSISGVEDVPYLVVTNGVISIPTDIPDAYYPGITYIKGTY